MISNIKKIYSGSSTCTLEGYKRWYELADKVIDIKRVEIMDSDDRYIMIPKLIDPHLILREDSESGDDTLK